MKLIPRCLLLFITLAVPSLLLLAGVSRADSITTGDLSFDCKKCLKPSGSFVYDNTFNRFLDVTVNWDHMQFSFDFVAFSSMQFLYNELLNGELLFYLTTDGRDSVDGHASVFLFSSDTEMLFRTNSPDPAIDVTFEWSVYAQHLKDPVSTPEPGVWLLCLAALGLVFCLRKFRPAH
jgi:hypothetical protein